MELLGWMILVGLAVNIVGIVMLSWQIERQTRVTLEFIVQSKEMILANLPHSGRVPPLAGGPTVPERRQAQRRSPLTRLIDAAREERRTALQRRFEDLLQH